MATTLTMHISERVKVRVEPLTAQAFYPFGSVVANPRPDVHPSAFATHAVSLPANAAPANAGTAIQYRDAGAVRNLYGEACTGSSSSSSSSRGGGRGKPLMSIFACSTVEAEGSIVIHALERHPFTTQTFIPIASPAYEYLVVVAPNQPSNTTPDTANLPRWHGLPDLHRLRAFVASHAQAVTYGAGTWHAPMMALGEPGQRLDFVVVQFASGVAAEDCQLLELVSAEGEVRVVVGDGETAKL
ncbi:hypothetical protein XA68_16881 [Ophiocordyceps unilateralis]|uniref:Ureidoglycolate hydrolase n=1 Tax=Ophiocordyceps unilateralis TaxID=268505 RepID=A0A2A9P5G3_OPHUN|nr:hypothetical protein XA68_16881 [Ophiocordyceps unilateralis]